MPRGGHDASPDYKVVLPTGNLTSNFKWDRRPAWFDIYSLDARASRRGGILKAAARLGALVA